MRVLALSVAFLAVAGIGRSQPHVGEAPTHPPHAIQDNGFLIEEAYNQEEGVVQHINLFQRDWHTGEWLATFTQEYPVGGIAHQLSYTASYQRAASSAGTFSGLGDLALNYRYQLFGNAESKVAVAPRLTLFLPTGRARKGLGAGATGVQIGLPLSVVLGDDWIMHGNIGGTLTPSARNSRGDKANTQAEYVGGSLIWLGGAGFDVMLEALGSRFQEVTGPGRTQTKSSFFLSPGVRWAYDFRSGLQIVPGIGVPIGLGSSRGQYAVLLYLSFEHPFQTVTSR